MAGNEGQGAGAGGGEGGAGEGERAPCKLDLSAWTRPGRGTPLGPRSDDPVGCVNELLAATVFDREIAMKLHANFVISWELIRALMWITTDRDLGPEPNWGDPDVIYGRAPIELGAGDPARTTEAGE